MTDATRLRAEHLTKSFAGRRVLDDVSLSVAKGEVKGIIGPSGAGKSTLIRCLNGLEPLDTGRVWLGADELTARKADIDALRARIGFVFQDFNLFTHLRVADNLMLGLRRVRKMDAVEAERCARAELDRVGLADKWQAWPAELSGGQAQRVSIARALAMAPEVMLFDEPTSALDPQSVGSVLRVMRELVAGGMTMIIVSHEMAFIEAVADDVVFMADGAIVEEGPAGQLFNTPHAAATRAFIDGIAAAHRGEATTP
ncbi:amino acid ABC transporter ATP-binding protein [Salinisphaera sp. Q1T1-3]|uniref:amino acid ABC transporter ATP-binding protein n=1 Tax=Salinisphaera sp. Q1T1-3 TaxID=2321229 RepID=UPI000E7400E6|nr:amino acid ABC transporter ATP-binding protein [Salinisphaera sp. Q1T1-3]RJS92846.1 amino acid ABC transporter ATP-binding protein [Salinisphaera sp. Q1T1-3]